MSTFFHLSIDSFVLLFFGGGLLSCPFLSQSGSLTVINRIVAPISRMIINPQLLLDFRHILHRAPISTPMVTGCPAGGAELLPDLKGSTALHLAARHGHGATAQRLCGRSNVSAPNAAGRTALHLAAWQGHLEVAPKHACGMVGIHLPKFQWKCLKHAMQGLDVDFLPWQETLGCFFFSHLFSSRDCLEEKWNFRWRWFVFHG